MRVLHFLDVRDSDVVRHVVDLATAQVSAGHEVGVVCGDADADRATQERLLRLQPRLALGLHGVVMNRKLALSDLSAIKAAYAIARTARADLVHGHGLKGGAICRLCASLLRRRGQKQRVVYSPHGQALDGINGGGFPAALERRLLRRTDGIVFECRYAKEQYERRFSPLPRHAAIIPYGIGEDEFGERQILDTATDFLYVGDLIRARGLDVLVMSLARMKRSRLIGAVIIGAGEEETELRKQVDRYGLAHQVFFNSPMARDVAFLKGGCLVLPARKENFPRVVLEAAGLGMPMILTNAGGIPELVGNTGMPLIPPDNVEALVAALNAYLDDPKPLIERTLDLKKRVAAEFTTRRMTDATEALYAAVMK
jgi:glycosyltransferase involved in cell wall biosynthesis